MGRVKELIFMVKCGVLNRVVEVSTGEILSLVQMSVEDSDIVVLKEESGRLTNTPVDKLVCSTCHLRIYPVGLDTFLCENSLRQIYSKIGVSERI
jgi:uncharacterized protein YlaI